MRVVHFAPSGSRLITTPLCGDWGSLDADWTDEPAGVTCVACRQALAGKGSPPAGAVPQRWSKGGPSP